VMGTATVEYGMLGLSLSLLARIFPLELRSALRRLSNS
jgi:hypothetical protein